MISENGAGRNPEEKLKGARGGGLYFLRLRYSGRNRILGEQRRFFGGLGNRKRQDICR